MVIKKFQLILLLLLVILLKAHTDSAERAQRSEPKPATQEVARIVNRTNV